MSAMLPEGYRLMKRGEVLREGDKLLLTDGTAKPTDYVGVVLERDQQIDFVPYIRRIETTRQAQSPADALVDSIARRHKKSLAEVERLAIAAVRKAVFARRHAADVREFKSKCMKGKK